MFWLIKKKTEEEWQKEVVLKPMFRISLKEDDGHSLLQLGWKIKEVGNKIFEASRIYLPESKFEVREGEIFTAPGVGDIVYKISDGFLIQYFIKK